MASDNEDGVIVRLDIPLDHAPQVIAGDSSGARSGRMALEAIYVGLGKINDLAKTVESKPLLAEKVLTFAEGVVERTGKSLTALEGIIKAHDAEIARVLKPPVQPVLQQEIRAHFAGGRDPFIKIKAQIDAGNMEVVSATLHVSPFLSGLDAKQQGVLRQEAARVLAPAQVAARAEAVDAIARVRKSNEHFQSTVANLIRTWQSTDAKVIRETLTHEDA